MRVSACEARLSQSGRSTGEEFRSAASHRRAALRMTRFAPSTGFVRSVPLKECQMSKPSTARLPRDCAPQRMRGLTLVELLVTLALVALLLTLAVPSFKAQILRSRIASDIDLFHSSLRLTRSEALKRGSTVTMCMSTTAGELKPACATDASAGWHSGWIIFVNRDEPGVLGDNDYLLRVQGSTSGSDRITSNDKRYISFYANGLAGGGGLTASFDPVNASDADRERFKRDLCVSPQGRVKPCGDRPAL
jgi:type IV fimbrial biogenesis protein FimT